MVFEIHSHIFIRLKLHWEVLEWRRYYLFAPALCSTRCLRSFFIGRKIWGQYKVSVVHSGNSTVGIKDCETTARASFHPGNSRGMMMDN